MVLRKECKRCKVVPLWQEAIVIVQCLKRGKRVGRKIMMVKTGRTIQFWFWRVADRHSMVILLRSMHSSEALLTPYCTVLLIFKLTQLSQQVSQCSI